MALADGATGVARTALDAAIAGWDAKGRIWEATWARLDLAQCLIRSNRFAEALALAIEARTVASGLDSQPLADRADALQRMARGRVAVDEPWRPLTVREFAVARHESPNAVRICLGPPAERQSLKRALDTLADIFNDTPQAFGTAV